MGAHLHPDEGIPNGQESLPLHEPEPAPPHGARAELVFAVNRHGQLKPGQNSKRIRKLEQVKTV